MTGLDGLRAIAVGCVMLVHAGAPGMAAGWLGVDLFFAISGFLITTLLIREFERTGGVSLPKFWARRAVRLMPAYWLYIGSITILITVAHWGWLEPEHGGWSLRQYIASMWLYFINLVPMGGLWEHQELTVHLWSLAVEEQFYFLWPVLFALFARRGRIEWVAWALVAAIVVARAGADAQVLHSQIHTRGLAIMFACAFALTSARLPALARPLARPGVQATITIATALCFLVPTGLEMIGRVDEDFCHRYFVPPFSVAATLLVATLWHASGGPIAAALSWRPLAYVGKISYGVYLYHMVARYLTWEVFLPGIASWSRWPKFGLRLAVFAALTMAMASLSYHLIERPFLAWKARLR